MRMRLARTVGLLLVPDLRAVVRRLQEVQRGLGVAEDWSAETNGWIEKDNLPAAVVANSEATTAVRESRVRIGEALAVLTGRKPE